MNRALLLKTLRDWWVLLAALTLATLIMSTRLPDPVFNLLGFGLLALLSLVVAALTFRTLVAIRRQEICVPE